MPTSSEDSTNSLSASFLTGVLEATEDGLLVVDQEGRMRYYNERFANLWELPEDVLTSRSDEKALQHATDQLANPDQFLAQVESIYKQEDIERRDRLEFKDGRVVERYTRPIRRDGNTIGRVWSFRDITEQLRARQEAERAKERWLTVVELAPTGIAISNVETGHFLTINEEAASILGYAPDDALKQSTLEMDAGVEPERRAELINEVREQEGVRNKRLTVQNRSGDPQYVLWSARILEWDDEEYLFQTLQDVTEQRKRQQALRRSEERYRSLFENSRDAIAITQRDGTIVDVNPAAENLTGYEQKELIGMDVREHYPDPESRKQYQQAVEEQGYVEDYEVDLERKDGEVRTCLLTSTVRTDEDGDIVGYQSIMRDVTEQRQREQQLRQSERRYRSLFEDSPVPIVITTEEGEFVRANEAFLEITGYSRKELQEQAARDLYADPDRRQQLREQLEESGSVSDFEVTLTTKQGARRRLQFTSSYQTSHDGEKRLIRAIGRDVTEERQRQKALRQSEQRYRSLFELSNDAIFIFDQEGRIEEVNERAAEFLGLSSEELERKTVLDLHPEGQPDAKQALEQTVSEGEGRFELQFRRTDGDVRVGEVSTRRVEVGDTPLFQAVVRDITEERERQERLRHSERRYRELFEYNVAGVFRSRPDGTIVECNQAFADIFGYEAPEQLEGQDARTLYRSPEARTEYVERLHEEGQLVNEELELENREGRPVWVLENSFLTKDPETGEVINEGTVIDITDRKKAEDRLEEMALHDKLTGVPNRRLLRERADQALTLAERQGTQVGLVYLDLVSFKMINDSLGHSAGDQVLVQVAKQLRSRARESDTVARVGGDEFVVLLPDVDGVSGLHTAAERFGEIFDTPFVAGDRAVHLDSRMGGALYPDHAGDFDNLLSNADRALTQTRTREGRFAVHEHEVEAPEADELATAEALRRALREDEFAVYYQPIVRPQSGELVGLESLLRWPQEDGQVLTAGQFLPVAERIGLTPDMDRWVLRQVARRLGEWSGFDRPQWVGVNLSARAFQDPELAEYIREVIEDAGAECSRLVIEITERAALRDPDQTAETIEALQQYGVRIAIDDFGTGYSALAHLKRYAADVLKVDMLFTEEFGREEGSADLGRAIAELGHASNAEVVAEGIERAEQSEWLKETGYDYAQGYHFGRPAPAEELDLPPDQ